MSLIVRCSAVFATALILSLAAPADAGKPLTNDHYFYEESDDVTDCGLDLHYEGTFWGHFLLFDVPDSGGEAFLGHDNYRYRITFTNTANGEWMLLRGKALFKEFTATHVTGDIWQFTAHETGQPFVVEDSDGNVVLRDRGRLSFRATFDTLGDGQPGGELIEEEVTSESGPHPGFHTDFCEIVTDLIG